MGYLWIVIGLSMLGFLVQRGGRVWLDARRRGSGTTQAVGWALMGAVAPARYWWDARITALPTAEREDLLARGTRALGLSRADSLPCPLCGTEIPSAWTVTRDGRPAVAPGPIECPICDFRLDTCRHCSHFLPGSAQTWQQSSWSGMDPTSGRCSRYKASQPVEQTCAPDMARQLRARGYDQIRAPLQIVDSFVPPDFCRAFAPEQKRLKQSGVRWPDAQRAALLRLLELPRAPSTSTTEKLPQGDELWLV